MKLITAMAFAAGMLLGGVGGVGAQELRVNEIGVQSIEGNSKVDMFRPEKDQLAIPRNFDKQQTNISPRRYFCMQCHVAQFDAKPLVGNSYKPAAKKGE